MALYHAVDDLPHSYHHIYLSPHFDDAVLSCGGSIAAQTARTERVLVITLCSAPPPAQLTSFARHLHDQWGAHDQPIATRRHEDQVAVERLGADLLWLDQLDAIYRHPAYESVAAIFDAPVPNDPLYSNLGELLLAASQRLSSATWYTPLAVGNHVDHRITHDVVSEERFSHLHLAWYEDLPYATDAGAVARRLAATGAAWSQRAVDISQTFERKLAAIAEYASQIKELFGDQAAMRARMTAYAAAVAPDGASYGERQWLKVDP